MLSMFSSTSKQKLHTRVLHARVLVGAATTDHHRLGGFNNEKFCFLCSRGWMGKIRIPAWSDSWGGSSSGFCAHMAFLCFLRNLSLPFVRALLTLSCSLTLQDFI